ncbi:unnamed protein product [Onchocerca flexuosa]|uniref:Uncharacterized protein n=1 Tax=Onchocerca flexuosa TaxID=387005 RepID=A0A183H1G6_9BILA|nr:unnamed protein product [Onchocerca flexuosa]
MGKAWLGSSNSGGRDDCETEAISLDSCASVLEPSHREGKLDHMELVFIFTIFPVYCTVDGYIHSLCNPPLRVVSVYHNFFDCNPLFPL